MGCLAVAMLAVGLVPASRAAFCAGVAVDPGQTVLALYTIGSDFEDDVDPLDGKPDEAASGRRQPKGASSNDLREIAAGWQALSPARRARVKVLVMLGGARKEGWRGTRLLDGPALVRDAADGYFGNLPDRAYLERQPTGRMSDPLVLRHFLEVVRARAASAGTVIVELAGHGASYGGLGEDMNQPAGRRWIGLAAIGRAFAAADLHGTILAFPACHMASVEVARAIGPRFQYLVGSEEGMSNEGWNYRTVFARLGRIPPVPARAIARTYVDSLMDDPGHQETHYKTASVIDLRRAIAIGPALDAWATQVDLRDASVRTAVLAVARSRHGFGLEAATDPPVSLDAIDYFDALSARAPHLRPACRRVVAAPRAAVVHHRGDPGYEQALGVSIYPPHLPLTKGEGAGCDEAVAASPGYWRVIGGLRPFLPAWPSAARKAGHEPALSPDHKIN